MKMIAIIQSSSGKVVASVPVSFAISDHEYLEEAWLCAVADGLVEADRRDDYSFVLA